MQIHWILSIGVHVRADFLPKHSQAKISQMYDKLLFDSKGQCKTNISKSLIKCVLYVIIYGVFCVTVICYTIILKNRFTYIQSISWINEFLAKDQVFTHTLLVQTEQRSTLISLCVTREFSLHYLLLMLSPKKKIKNWNRFENNMKN